MEGKECQYFWQATQSSTQTVSAHKKSHNSVYTLSELQHQKKKQKAHSTYTQLTRGYNLTDTL